LKVRENKPEMLMTYEHFNTQEILKLMLGGQGGRYNSLWKDFSLEVIIIFSSPIWWS
jgi:hypothetical protein